jgi:hypothetical protein
MKRKIFIIALVVLAMGILLRPPLLSALFHSSSKQEVVQKIFANPQLFEVVTSAQEVTVQRLYETNSWGGGMLNSYRKDAPVPLSSDEASKLKLLLQNPSSYLWDIANSCIPDYGVLFKFQSKGRTVRVAFCFKCNMVGVFDGEADDAKEVNSVYMFDPMRRSVAEICKESFPNDKEIQSLK